MTPDVLITHDKFGDSQRGYGSVEITEVMDKLAFAYHFTDILEKHISKNLADNGIIQSVKIKELEFDGEGKLSEGVC